MDRGVPARAPTRAPKHVHTMRGAHLCASLLTRTLLGRRAARAQRLDNIIDLLACLPFWITLIIQAVTKGEASGGLGFVRVIRLVRVFRVFKSGRYSLGIKVCRSSSRDSWWW